MIDAKAAVQVAKKKAVELLDQVYSGLEEIERDSYKDHDVWSITLSMPRDFKQLAPLAQLSQLSENPLQYKRFLIDVETGELVALKLRETAIQ
jgi:hypothetical protein